MGGFEGGDEAGFWDVVEALNSINKRTKSQTIPKPSIQCSGATYSMKAHAKVNIFLKISGYKNDYHTLSSRFMRVESLYDTISFVPSTNKTFTIEGCENIPLKSNTIYKAYKALIDFTADSDIEDFFQEHKVVLKKNIPSGAGLGGGSSDAAAFIHLTKELCNLVLTTDELVKIGSSIGADVTFFLYNCSSANVSGFGEIVRPFEEETLDFDLFTPNTRCDTSLVYKTFKDNLLENINVSSFDGWDKLNSRKVLELSSDATILNDLYAAALIAYPELKNEVRENWFFSGSGSTFFKVR